GEHAEASIAEGHDLAALVDDDLAADSGGAARTAHRQLDRGKSALARAEVADPAAAAHALPEDPVGVMPARDDKAGVGDLYETAPSRGSARAADAHAGARS